MSNLAEPKNTARIGARQALQHVTSAGAILVCAYDDEAKCQTFALENSISLHELEGNDVAHEQELIFYCA